MKLWLKTISHPLVICPVISVYSLILFWGTWQINEFTIFYFLLGLFEGLFIKLEEDLKKNINFDICNVYSYKIIEVIYYLIIIILFAIAQINQNLFNVTLLLLSLYLSLLWSNYYLTNY